MRRLLALALLLLTAASALESVLGVLRDGAVHHESAVTAAFHALDARGDHGHEDVAHPGDHRHSPGHEHGTGSDHCTHQHGPAMLTSAVEPLFTSVTREGAISGSAFPPDRTPLRPFHPPRA